MQLHYLPGSPFARVARIVALELAAPCDFLEDSGFPPKGVEALNPAMQVPTLVDGARRVFGTKLIAEYLMACHRTRAEPGLLPFAALPTRPADHWRDAQVLVALEALLNALVLRSYLIWTGARHASDAAIPLDLADRERERAHRLLDWLEGEATPAGFLPEVFSLQDAWLVSTIAWTEARIRIPWRGRPALEAIVERVAQRESVRRTVPSPWPYEGSLSPDSCQADSAADAL